jgi:uncharacterized protein (DUF1015 family)
MADVRPFRALRFNPELDMSAAVCPPFDTIPPQLQRELYERSPYNAVRIELAEGEGDTRYENAAGTLRAWLQDGTVRRDANPAFYLLKQTFTYDGHEHTRTILFGRLRVVPWDEGEVLPHEQTFPKHKDDRLRLMRAAHVNASPVFLFYRSNDLIRLKIMEAEAIEHTPVAEFDTPDGQHLKLVRVDAPIDVSALERYLREERLYVADGHHRYETALNYRDEVRSQRGTWTGDEPENFAMVGLVAEDDPGLLVLPTHRVVASHLAWPEVRSALEAFFDVEPIDVDADELAVELAARHVSALGFAAKSAGTNFILTPKETHVIDHLLPQDRSPAWRALDYAICDWVVVRHCLGLSEDETKDQSRLWFTESAREAVAQAREGSANYAVVLNHVPVHRVLELADLGERMPQKSTFFYPKVPAGLVFNLLED